MKQFIKQYSTGLKLGGRWEEKAGVGGPEVRRCIRLTKSGNQRENIQNFKFINFTSFFSAFSQSQVQILNQSETLAYGFMLVTVMGSHGRLPGPSIRAALLLVLKVKTSATHGTH